MKSYVSVAQHQCPVCLRCFDSGEVLLDRKLRASMERNTLVGRSLCPEHKKLFDEGYIAFVEAIKVTEGIQHTGRIAHIKREACKVIFTTEFADDLPMAYLDPEAMVAIEALATKEM